MKLSAINAKKEKEICFFMLEMLTECHTFVGVFHKIALNVWSIT